MKGKSSFNLNEIWPACKQAVFPARNLYAGPRLSPVEDRLIPDLPQRRGTATERDRAIASDTGNFDTPGGRTPFLWDAFRRFSREEGAAVTAEFVIILPIFLMLFSLMIGFSVMLVTASEVQQASFELARSSVRYYEPGVSSSTVCSDVEQNIAPGVLSSGFFTQQANFTNIDCSLNTATGEVSFTLTYALGSSNPVQILSLVGVRVSDLTRTATMWM